MSVKLELTERRFARGEFRDIYGSVCSIQESSNAEVDAIWLGVEIPFENYNGSGFPRMHLNQEQVAALLPLLQHFVENGYLPYAAKERS